MAPIIGLSHGYLVAAQAAVLPPPTAFSFIGALATTNVEQAIGAGANVAVNWPTEVRDTDAIHDLVTNNSRLTIPSALNGRYCIIIGSARLRYLSNPGEGGKLNIRKNNSESYSGFGQIDQQGEFSNVTDITLCTAPILVATSDFFELFVESTGASGATVKNSELAASFGIWVVA